MTCPACAAAVDLAPVVNAIAICPACLASVVVEGESVRRATAEDTRDLTNGQLRTLRGVRKQYRGAA